jgi:hypothetical protein
MMAWSAERKRTERATARLARIDGAYTPVWDSADPKEDRPTSLAKLAATIETNLFHWEMKEYVAAIPLALEKGSKNESGIKQLIGCSGASGIGKSYELRKACAAAGLKENEDWGYITSNKDTDLVIAQMALAMEEGWKLIAFDDHDTLFRSSIMPEVIKTGWGPGRVIQRNGGFSVAGLTCVFLSNKDITWFARGNVDLEAVFRRGQFRNIRGTKTQMFRYIIYRATHEPDFFAQYPTTTKQSAVLFFNEHRNRLRNLSLHGFEAICYYYQHNADNPVKREMALRQALTHTEVHSLPGFDDADIEAAMKALSGANKRGNNKKAA